MRKSFSLQLLSVIMLLIVSSCKTVGSNEISNINRPVTSPHVIVTMMTALLVGPLENDEGCLIVTDERGTRRYTLVWPADVSVKIDGDKVYVKNGLVSGNPTEFELSIGENVFVGGGEVKQLPPDLEGKIPQTCIGPYWVIGKMWPANATDSP